MIPNTFSYARPTMLEEAFGLLDKGATCLAGGTDVLVKLRGEKLDPTVVMDCKAIPELQGIRPDRGGLFIGAATPIQDICEHEAAQPYQALIEGAGVLGCYEIRQRATIGGNICNASPSGDTLPGLLVYDAQLILVSSQGSRTLPLCEFLLGPSQTALRKGELLQGVWLPAVSEQAASRFYRCTRVKGMDLAGINIALYYDNDADLNRGSGSNADCFRIAIGAVWPTVVRVRAAEALLNSEQFTPELLERAIDRVLEDAHPRATSLRATPDYKRSMIRSFMQRGFVEMIGGGRS